jgi:type IV pilus assembly protein PilW
MILKSVRGTAEQRGLSLIEFMIAILLGTILIGGAVSIYLASSRSYTETERAVSLGNSARFALQVMTDSLRHVGFMAGLQGQDVERGPNLDDPDDDCAVDTPCEVYDPSSFLYAVRHVSGTEPTPFAFIDDAMADTDILMVKYLLPEPLYDADPNDPAAPTDGVFSFPDTVVPANKTSYGLDKERTYVVSNAEFGILVDGADTDTPPDLETGQYKDARAWPYQFEVYYVRDPSEDDPPSDDPPVLTRMILKYSSGAMELVREDLVEGVENLRFRFGFDTNANGNMDTFRDLRAPADPTTWDWSAVGLVEVFVLVRSLDADPNYADGKTYDMLGLDYTPADDDPNSPAEPHPQEYVRLLVSSPIMLRNRLLYIRGGQ